MSALKNFVNGSLKSKLVELIQLKGPLTVSEYMKIVLTNPSSGFYMNNDVFGVKGHFTTSPEISQIFGEILGVWILQEWRRFNCPKPLRLVELGPGRGTLMRDIARTFKAINQNHKNVHIQFVELSPRLRQMQQKSLEEYTILSEHTRWYNHIDDIETTDDGFTAYIAHEFLDALPIHKFIRDPNTGNWRELVIDYDQKHDLRFCLAKQPSMSTRLLIPRDFEGDHLEVCPEAALHLEKVMTRLNLSGKGCMLICDYGFEDNVDESPSEITTDNSSMRIKSNRDTFRAFKDHELWPPLKNPGEADLTADVDFGYLKTTLKDKAVVFGSIQQEDFLLQCGLQARLKALLDKADDVEKKELTSGANMLVKEMGRRYRFMSLFPKGVDFLFEGDPPAGFNKMT